MLRGLLALVALLAPSAFPVGPSDVPASEPEACLPCMDCWGGCHEPAPFAEGPEVSFLLEDDLLPAATGWFLVPLEVDAPGLVRIEVLVDLAMPRHGHAAYATLVVPPAETPDFAPSAFGIGTAPWLAVHDGGEAVACCRLPEVQDPGIGGTCCGSLISEDVREHWIEPGAPLWLGFVAHEWSDESAARFIVRSTAPGARLGAVQTGLDVVAFDLVQDAVAAGRNVQVTGWVQAGQASDVHVELSAMNTGLLVLDQAFSGSAKGRLLVTLPDGTLHDNGRGTETRGLLRALQPGTVRVQLTDVDPPRRDASGNVYGDAYATLLFADLPLPSHPTFAWDIPQPTHG